MLAWTTVSSARRIPYGGSGPYAPFRPQPAARTKGVFETHE